jgi:hypothetical protein
VKLPNQKQSIIVWRPEKDGLFVKKYLDHHVILNVTVENTKKSDLRVLSVIAVVLKSLLPKFAVSAWVTFPLAAPVTHLWYLSNTPSPISVF